MSLSPIQSQELGDGPQQIEVTESSWRVGLHYECKSMPFIIFLHLVLTSTK